MSAASPSPACLPLLHILTFRMPRLTLSTKRGATIDIDLSHVKFLGNLTLNLWDCGGQEAFMENYLVAASALCSSSSNVGELIYVFDIESRGRGS